MWFDLSTREGFVSHVVVRHQALRGQSVLLVVFNGSKVVSVRAIRFFLVECWLYLEDNSRTG